MDAVLEEFCRVSGTLQIHVFRRMQRYFMSELGPKIDRLEAENAALRAELDRKELVETAADVSKVEAAYVRTEAAVANAEPLKRKRGRPRKHPIEEPVAV